MPIAVYLKEPRTTLFIEKSIGEVPEEFWDKLFHNEVMITKSASGNDMIIPLLKESNIALMEDVSGEEYQEYLRRVEEAEKAQKEQKKEGRIVTPQMAIPKGRR